MNKKIVAFLFHSIATLMNGIERAVTESNVFVNPDEIIVVKAIFETFGQ